MTVRECLDRVRATPGAAADEDMMLVWLSDVEGLIFEEIMAHREGAPIDGFEGYADSDGEAVLLAKEPYASLYVYYVTAQIYLSYADIARYNTYLALYRDAYEEFAGYWARGHRQKGNTRLKI